MPDGTKESEFRWTPVEFETAQVMLYVWSSSSQSQKVGQQGESNGKDEWADRGRLLVFALQWQIAQEQTDSLCMNDKHKKSL
jgi:hypothetical protein